MRDILKVDNKYERALESLEDDGISLGAGDYLPMETLLVCKEALEEQIKIENDIDNFSDGYHTFNQLYYQRTILFSIVVNQNKNIAWKTRNHEDGKPCFGGGWFLVTIDTPEGAYGYHCEDKYWDLFKCQEIEKAKPWDGYTEENVDRLFSLLK